MESMKIKKPKFPTKVGSYGKIVYEGRDDGIYSFGCFDHLMVENKAEVHGNSEIRPPTRLYSFEGGASVKYEHNVSEDNAYVRITAIGTKNKIKNVESIIENAKELIAK